MKKAIIAVALVVMVLLSYNSASAATVYENTGTIKGEGSWLRSFDANVSPFTYIVSLTDLSDPPETDFNTLGMLLFDSNGIIDTLFGPGNFTYEAEPNQKYLINVFVDAGFSTGEFGVKVETVPIPAAVWLLGGGLLGLVGLRRRFKS